jgi:uncharacterized protein YjaG (DUF416 family)
MVVKQREGELKKSRDTEDEIFRGLTRCTHRYLYWILEVQTTVRKRSSHDFGSNST